MVYLRKSLQAAALVCATALSTSAMAQTTVTVPVTASVSNTVTATATQSLEFGTIVAKPTIDDAITATMATDGTLSFSAQNGVEVIAAIDSSAAQPAIVTVTDAADGATLNVTVGNVVNPTNGGESFTLDTFTRRNNGALSETPVAIDDPFELAYADNAGSGSTIAIGATITGAAGDTFTATTPYVGSFDVTVDY